MWFIRVQVVAAVNGGAGARRCLLKSRWMCRCKEVLFEEQVEVQVLWGAG